MQTPTIGRIVILKGHKSNGSDEHPAIITRVWNEDAVNLTAFPDFEAPKLLTSVAFRQSRADAEAFHTKSGMQLVAFWPDLA